ncbi:MAG: alpha-L-fucosidase [Akkermansiaceae bacterium]|nr:alpha-L-fucosidase [Akkermansiaceae bacterium]
MNRYGYALIGLITLACVSAMAADKPADSNQVTAKAIERWQDLRFGMFITWGPATLTGKEISWSRNRETPTETYDNLYKQFNPTKFNADEWVAIAKASGMKYLVLICKHCDGFCLWDTKYTDYNIMHSPFGRDVVKELSEACKREGMPFGVYYSVSDYRHPGWAVENPRVKRAKYDLDAYAIYLQNQVRELLQNYGHLLTIWFDADTGPEDFTAFAKHGLETIDFARKIQPDIVINNRTLAARNSGDYATPERNIGDFNMVRPWETCWELGSQWAWKPNDTPTSLKSLLHTLIKVAGNDGNLLLNAGPKSTGEFEPEDVARLKEIGTWLKQYGESIYGTRGGPYLPSEYGSSTRKGQTVYLHILNMPASGKLHLPALPAKVVSSRLLTGGEVTVTASETSIDVAFSPKNRDNIDTIVALELDRPTMELKVINPNVCTSPTTGK